MLLLKIHGDSFGTAILIACLRTGDIIVQVLMALSFSAVFSNGVFMVHVLVNIGREFE